MLDFLKVLCPVRVSIDDSGDEFTGWPSIEGNEGSDMTLIHRAGFKQEFFGDLSQKQAVALAHELVRIINETHWLNRPTVDPSEGVRKLQSLLPVGVSPRTILVLGRGWGRMAESILSDMTSIDYQTVGFPSPKGGQILHGWAARTDHHLGTEVMILRGGTQPIDGYSMQEITLPLRTLLLLGCENVVLIDLSKALDERFSHGELVLIRDHLNLMCDSPLRGPNNNQMGPRFPDLTKVYEAELRRIVQETATRLFGSELKTGLYAGVMGSQTPSEARMLRGFGADLMGMSIVPEAIVARHMGARVLGLSGVGDFATDQVDLPPEMLRRTTQLLQGVLAQLG